MFFDEFGGLIRQIPIELIAQVCLSFVLLIGLFVYFAAIKPARKQRREKRLAAERAQTASEMPELDQLSSAPAARRTLGEYEVRLPDGRAAAAREMLVILRDQSDGRLIVMMDGTGYRTLVDQPVAKQKFTKLMKELAEVVASADGDTGSPARAPATPVAAAPPAPRPAPAVPSPVEAVPEPQGDDDEFDSMELEAPDLEDLARFDDPAPAPPPRPVAPVPSVTRPPAPPPLRDENALPGDLPRFRELIQQEKVQGGGMFRQPRVESEPVPELNIAGAIEAYLQHKLQRTPEYYGRSIHVHSAIGGGVVIEVDGEYFEAVSDVRDPEVREFIATAIQEWQERQ